MSRMIYSDEVEARDYPKNGHTRHGLNRYKYLRDCEWYDFLVRIAQTKYGDMGCATEEKVENLLDELFKLIKKKRKDYEQEDRADSESDYNSDE